MILVYLEKKKMEKIGNCVLFLNTHTHTSELAVRHHQPGLLEVLSHFAKRKSNLLSNPHLNSLPRHYYLQGMHQRSVNDG